MMRETNGPAFNMIGVSQFPMIRCQSILLMLLLLQKIGIFLITMVFLGKVFCVQYASIFITGAKYKARALLPSNWLSYYFLIQEKHFPAKLKSNYGRCSLSD